MRSGRVFADARGNVVFRLRDEAGQEVGYEVRGTYEKPYHSVHGEKGLFITKADETRSAAFVESGIEALSYRALRGAGLILSTTGSAIEKPASDGAAAARREAMRSSRRLMPIRAGTGWPSACTNSSASR